MAQGKARVHELAAEFGVTAKDILVLLSGWNEFREICEQHGRGSACPEGARALRRRPAAAANHSSRLWRIGWPQPPVGERGRRLRSGAGEGSSAESPNVTGEPQARRDRDSPLPLRH